MRKELCLSMILIGLGMPLRGHANNSFSANRTGGTIRSLITMTVKTP